MKIKKMKKWHVVGLIVTVALIAFAAVIADDWWAIYYAKYLAGIDNAYKGAEGQVCFTPATQNTKATPKP
jgi:hypothetical protein